MEPRPGDILLVNGTDWQSKCIAAAQRIHRQSGSRWTHVAMFVGAHSIVEATGRGVRYNRYLNYVGMTTRIVPVDMEDLDRQECKAFLCHEVGMSYGFPTIASVGLRLLTNGSIGFGQRDTVICSTLVAKALERANIIVGPDCGQVVPADIAEHFGVPG